MSVVVLALRLGGRRRVLACRGVVDIRPIDLEVAAVACSLGVEVGRNLDAYLAPDRTESREGM